jgi:serralysin
VTSVFGSERDDFDQDSTNFGNNTYGFHSKLGSFYDYATYSTQGTPAFTIYDNGPNNTLDASGYSADQILDATPGHWSSIGGFVDNVGVYLTTLGIANLIGGSGNDLLIPSAFTRFSTRTGGGGQRHLSGKHGQSSRCDDQRYTQWL